MKHNPIKELACKIESRLRFVKHKKSVYLILPLLLFFNVVSAQAIDSPGMSKANLYLEFGSNIIVTSVNVNLEAKIAASKSGKINLYGRAGLGGSAVYWGNAGWGGLGALTLLTGKGKHHFEGSGGVFLGVEPATSYVSRSLFVLPLIDLGYRYQKPGSGFIFRGKVGTLGIGVGLGYAF